ncbi:transcription factor SOX-1 [Rattus rattus]|uniref:transcription factor SOX-1 n=1 Tax=Rattus rattus TaxID=10117 RepID=UPI0013F32800|nr:transcription factor SOX-1 [Rattus rattus]
MMSGDRPALSPGGVSARTSQARPGRAAAAGSRAAAAAAAHLRPAGSGQAARANAFMRCGRRTRRRTDGQRKTRYQLGDQQAPAVESHAAGQDRCSKKDKYAGRRSCWHAWADGGSSAALAMGGERGRRGGREASAWRAPAARRRSAHVNGWANGTYPAGDAACGRGFACRKLAGLQAAPRRGRRAPPARTRTIRTRILCCWPCTATTPGAHLAISNSRGLHRRIAFRAGGIRTVPPRQPPAPLRAARTLAVAAAAQRSSRVVQSALGALGSLWSSPSQAAVRRSAHSRGCLQGPARIIMYLRPARWRPGGGCGCRPKATASLPHYGSARARASALPVPLAHLARRGAEGCCSSGPLEQA